MPLSAPRDSGLSLPVPFFVFPFVHVHVGACPWAFNTAVPHARLMHLICSPTSLPNTYA
jgi:hypothetical protein